MLPAVIGPLAFSGVEKKAVSAQVIEASEMCGSV